MLTSELVVAALFVVAALAVALYMFYSVYKGNSVLGYLKVGVFMILPVGVAIYMLMSRS